MVILTIVLYGGYWAVVSTFPNHRGEFHSVIAGAVIAGVVAPSGAPWWLLLAIFMGTTSLFVLWSRATYAREQQELLAWRQQAVAELGMRSPNTPYHPPALTRSHTLVEGLVGDVHVTISRIISGSDVGPTAWYAVELKAGNRNQYENLDDKLTRNQVFPQVKRLLAAFQTHAS